MAAAVSDYIPAFAQDGKLKKDVLGATWDLSLKQNSDILNSIDKNDITTVAFKAEMDAKNALLNATKMLQDKKLDAVCLNTLKDSKSFGSDTNAVTFITASQNVCIEVNDKLSVAFEILNSAKNLQEC